MLRILSFIRGFLYLEFPLTEVPLYSVSPLYPFREEYNYYYSTIVLTSTVYLQISSLCVCKCDVDKSGADPKSIEAAADIHVQKNLVYGVHRKNFFANKSTEPSIELKSNIVYGVPNLKKSGE